MMSKRSLPVLILLLAAGVFIGFKTLGTNGNPPTKQEQILHNVGIMLEQVHYSPKSIDDKFSKEIFKKYLVAIDPDKSIFLQSDIQQLKLYETKIDDEILGGPVQFAPAVSNIFKTRTLEVEALFKNYLSKPLDFTKDESYIQDPEKRDFTASENERKILWEKKLKYMVLDRYVDLLEAREKNKGKQGFEVKTDAALEKEARDRVLVIMNRTFERFKFKFTADEQFNVFVNTITTTMDPHTTFFPPVEKRYFDEQMSGRFFGIGASLRLEDGQVKVTALLTGSPAWKSGEINAGDIIMKVAEGPAEPVDLTGFMLDEAVKLIRGKKGSEVRLTMKKADGSIKVVTLIRDEIIQDETFARSSIVTNGKSKIGYIFLPEFYADFDNPKGARCAVDVAKEVTKLKAEHVDGIVLDLRNNGGGSLYDVVQMVGLFIDEGPIVQVKDREGKPSILRDRDKTILYDGPLAVMVNEFSASASEIFAAAIQDYKRGVIIGSTSTYGKGTVQRNIGLDKETGFLTSNSDLGTIKLTLQKFYRINGGSTQLRGVSSDVVLPDVYELARIREKDDPDALPWDEIQKADYSIWKSTANMNLVKANSNARVSNNPAFNLIKTNTEWLSKQNDKMFYLNITKFRDEKRKVDATVKQLETLNKLPKELTVSTLMEDKDKFANDTDKAERFKQWQKILSNDLYLNEAVNVIDDVVAQQNIAAAKPGY